MAQQERAAAASNLAVHIDDPCAPCESRQACLPESLIIVQYVDEAWSSHAPGAPPFRPLTPGRPGAVLNGPPFRTAIRVLREGWAETRTKRGPGSRCLCSAWKSPLVECGDGRITSAATASALTWTLLWGRTSVDQGPWRGSLNTGFLDEAKVPGWPRADWFCAHPAVAGAMPGVKGSWEFSVKNDGVLKAASANSKRTNCRGHLIVLDGVARISSLLAVGKPSFYEENEPLDAMRLSILLLET
ncbi:hypothetical protein ZWY2020_042463 [Hordeum vulgare]|nr:hypothetical protein ZWY2020_042463 [Hordeum vulgare]